MRIDPPRGARLHLARLTMLPDTKAKFRAQGVTRGTRVICYCGGGSRPLISSCSTARLRRSDARRRLHGGMGEGPFAADRID